MGEATTETPAAIDAPEAPAPTETKTEAPAEAKAEPKAKELTFGEFLKQQGKLDSEFRISAITINTNLGVGVSFPEVGRRDDDGDFQMTSQLGQMQLSPEGMKELLDLKGEPGVSVVKTLKKFFHDQLTKKLGEPLSAQQIQQAR